REAYQNPYFLAEVDRKFYACKDAPLSRHEIIERYLPYVQKCLQEGIALKHITRHVLGLYQGLPGAKQFRRYLSENAHSPEADLKVLTQAVSRVH
ncbi:MAG: tRNA-dihydrouridine synthase, partial [Pseudohongiellaceae bacterium]